jgi:PAS domain S-box-containing protein
MSLKKHGIKLLAIIVPIFLIGYSLEWFKHYSSPVSDYFEIATELLPLVLSFTIFVITWNSSSKSKDNHTLFIGAVFFIIGLLNLYHMISYPFMPNFITPNSLQKSSIFWSEALLISAIFFLISAYIRNKTIPWLFRKSGFFTIIFVLSFILLIIGLFYPYYIKYYMSKTLSLNPILLFGIISVLIAYSIYAYIRRFRETKEENIICLIYSLIILLLSNLVYIYYDYSSNLLKAAAFYFVYMAIFKSSVEQPFEKQTEFEKKLRFTAEERYRSLVDNANDAIITTDLEGYVTSWNRSAEKTFGWPLEEVIGKKLLRLIVSPDKQMENELLFHNILMDKELFRIETVHKRKDGTKIDVNFTMSPLYNSSHIVIGLSCIIRDITERKRAEDIENENIRLALGIRTKDERLPAMSHDLGTPLNAILGFSELLKQKVPGELNKKQEQYVDNIMISGKRMLDIVDDILDLGRVETGKIYLEIEKFPVEENIDETTNLVREKITIHNVVLKKEIDIELEFMVGDRNRFKQIIFNLLSNSVKCSKPEGGTVTIKAKKEGNMAIFWISDTGIGIKEEDMCKLFKEFEQINLGLDSKYGSTGLGLVVTKKLVEFQGGNIWAESRYGEGSTFTFTLPLELKLNSKEKA